MARIGRSRPARDYKIVDNTRTTFPQNATGSIALKKPALAGTGLVSPAGTGSIAIKKPSLLSSDSEIFTGTGSIALKKPSLAGLGVSQNAFPPGPLGLLIELLVGDTWTDITDLVYQRDAVIIVRGRQDEASTSNPSTANLTLNNRDGRFSPRNPNGIYYGQIGRNTQLRISAPTTGTAPWVRGYRFWGEVSEWPPSWDPTGTDVYVQIQASGILRRLNQQAALRSTMFRYYSTLSGTAVPLAYWPAEDGTNATSIASGVQNGFPMTWSGSPQLASDSSFFCSSPIPSMNSAIFSGSTGVAGALPVASTVVFTTTGTHNWQAPAGVSEVLVECWGAGGGGSAYNGTQGGAGGGGGEYASDSVAVTPGSNYSYTVGSSSAGGNGGSSHFTGDSLTVTAHGGASGSSDGSTGGAGGTGSGSSTHFDGGAGSSGSGGPGGSGSSTQNNQAFTSSGTWSCPSDYVHGSLAAYVYGAGGGGGGGGSSNGGGSGGGGGFSQGNPSVTAGNNYPVTVGNGGGGGAAGSAGGDGGASNFNGGTSAGGGTGGHAAGTKGTGGSGDFYNGGDGASGDGNKGAGGGGGAGAGSGGTKGSDSASGGGGGAGGAPSGTLNGGGSGGNGGQSNAGAHSGGDGDPTGGGGGGGYTTAFGGTPGSGGTGGRGKVWLFYEESTGAPAAAIGGGGGSSGGSASAGNAGSTEAGGSAVDGGGPGGGVLGGSSFSQVPTSGPGGGGAGYDSLGSGNNGGAGYSGQVRISYAPSGGGSSSVSANVMRFLLGIPSGGDTDGSVVARMYTTGTIDYVDVIYNISQPITLAASGSPASNPNPNPVVVTVSGGTVTQIAVNGVNTGQTAGVFTVPGSGTITVTYSVAPTTFSTVPVSLETSGALTLSAFTGAGAQLFTSGEIAFGAEGSLYLISVELTPSGGNIAWAINGIVAGQTVVSATDSGTLSSATLGDPFIGVMNPNGTLTSTAWGHLAILETYNPVTDLVGPLAAYAGEYAADRFTRLCTENGVTGTITGTNTDTALVGPQLPENLVTLLQDCEDADRGLIYEPRDSFGLAYRTRVDLYNQSPAVQLDYSAQQLAQPLQPTDDDQRTRNDITISRPSGSSSEQMQTTGDLSTQAPPAGVGPYTYSQTINVDTDGQLPNLASWMLLIGTQDQLRYPTLNIDLSRYEMGSDFTDVVGTDIGDYLQVVNPPSWLPPGTIDQLVYGYTETLNAYIWTISANCVPEDPYDVALAYDTGAGVGARADTDGSVLHNGIGQGDTSFSVDTPSPNAVWVDSTDEAAEFPFDIIINGEQMTVSAISGSTAPQTFTVTRAINGIQIIHNAGESVNLYVPAITAL